MNDGIHICCAFFFFPSPRSEQTRSLWEETLFEYWQYRWYHCFCWRTYMRWNWFSPSSIAFLPHLHFPLMTARVDPRVPFKRPAANRVQSSNWLNFAPRPHAWAVRITARGPPGNGALRLSLQGLRIFYCIGVCVCRWLWLMLLSWCWERSYGMDI